MRVVVVGVKDTPTVQDAPTARDAGQLLVVIGKLPVSLEVMELSATDTVPLF